MFLALGIFMLSLLSLNAVDFSEADRSFRYSNDYQSCRAALETMLVEAADGKEKSEVLWRLSRVYLVLGEEQEKPDQKRPLYRTGIDFAQQSISENPSNPAAYMWHCASVGRECQTRSVMEQAKAVPLMIGDLEMILDKLGCTSYSEAWQALAEIYYHHPFKSDDAAINFMRQAVKTIPSDELRISTSAFLARLLLKRNWSAQKRRSASAQNAGPYAKAKSNIEKQTYADGAGIPDMSDYEEARAVIEAAKERYRKAPLHSRTDDKDYADLLNIL